MVELPLRRIRLSDRQGEGVSCDANGVFVGQSALLRRSGDGRHWQPRPIAEINCALTTRYGLPIDFTSKTAALASIARALNDCDIARAQIIALHLRLPDPKPLRKTGSRSAGEFADLARQLAECAILKADWDPTKHPRWPGGTGGGIGGEFAPAGSSSPSVSPPRPEADTPGKQPTVRTPGLLSEQPDARLIPVQAVMPLPFPMEIPDDIPFPLPSEIVPPPIIGPIPRNPFPDRAECVKEWADAEKYCDDLDRRNLLGKHPYKGHGANYDQCVRGQVTEDCGGSPVEWA